MIFSHIADTHLGLEQYGSHEREQDMYDSFNQAIDISINDHVDFVIFSGDIFDVPNPNGTAILQMANALKRLKENSIDSFFVLGEHDISRIRTTPIPYVYHNLGFSKYIGQGNPITIKNNNILLCGFDKIRKGEIPQFEEKFNKVNSMAKSHTGHHKIMVMHQGITEFNKFAGELVSTDLPSDFTYYAMGHLHDHDIKYFSHLKGPVAYPGSTELTSSEGIKETKKGFIEVDISTSEAKPNWIQLDNRPQISHDCEYQELSAAIDEIMDTIKELQKKSPIIEIKINGKGIETEYIQAQIGRLNELSLRCFWKIVSKESSDVSVLTQRPSKIENEMLRLATSATGSPQVADFAIRQLLPQLSSLSPNRIKEASQIILDGFEEFKKEEEMKTK